MVVAVGLVALEFSVRLTGAARAFLIASGGTEVPRELIEDSGRMVRELCVRGTFPEPLERRPRLLAPDVVVPAAADALDERLRRLLDCVAGC